MARGRAKRRVQDGHFKNGNPKFRTKFECAICKGLFEKEETAMDHINPVIETTGFTTWDAYLSSLFCGEEGYQCLCKECHQKKTQEENKQRRE